MRVVNGWTLYEHPLFVEQRADLIHRVDALQRKDPAGFQSAPETKLLAAIRKLTLESIPANPMDKAFRQGGTLGKARKHWFRAKFGAARYRLFFQFNSTAKVIIYAWMNDADSLRIYGARTDAYAVFKSMLNEGSPPDNWVSLLEAVTSAKVSG